MKKLLLTLFLLLPFILFAQTFTWETATEIGESQATIVQETVSDITVTVTTADAGGGRYIQLFASAGFGGASGNVVMASVTNIQTITFTFSESVDILTIYAVNASGSYDGTWTYTPTGGSNSPVNDTIAKATGQTVTLNWTNVTSFTVTKSEELSGFAFDDLILGDASLPVELTSFSAPHSNNTVELEWTTVSETDNLGFIIERKSENTGWRQIASYKHDAELTGQGTTSSPSQYDFIDNTISAGADYDYRLSEIDINGEKSEIGTTSVKAAIPSTTQLFTAYPNPFNPSTNIKYNLAKDSHVTLAVYDVLGRQIKLLSDQYQTAGQYSVQWDGSTDAGVMAPSGTYLVRMQTGNTSQVQKVLFMK